MVSEDFVDKCFREARNHEFDRKSGNEIGERYHYRECVKCHCIEGTEDEKWRCREKNIWPERRAHLATRELKVLREQREELNRRIMEKIYEIRQHKKEAGIE